MKEHGIIFNSEMVRAILDGSKTQTRRVMKSQPEPSKTKDGDYWLPCNKTQSMVHVSDFIPGNSKVVDMHEFYSVCCPLGGIGDRLWVRETWQGPLVDEDHLDNYRADVDKFQTSEFCKYAADGGPRPEFCDLAGNIHFGWRPSIHMPRWASRILLEITGVRVERLQDISEEDAVAEGVVTGRYGNEGNWLNGFYAPGSNQPHQTAKSAYSELWCSIYGVDAWYENPWVWCITFQQIQEG